MVFVRDLAVATLNQRIQTWLDGLTQEQSERIVMVYPTIYDSQGNGVWQIVVGVLLGSETSDMPSDLDGVEVIFEEMAPLQPCQGGEQQAA
jgi:hypothetical protein